MFFLVPQNTAYSAEVQYFLDKRFVDFTDSERVNSAKSIYYRHGDIIEKTVNEIDPDGFLYKKCSNEIESDYIVKLEPNFFYNPAMTIMYADLKYSVFIESGELIHSSKISLEKQMRLQILPQEQLKSLYTYFIKEINKNIQSIVVKKKIQGSFCKVLEK